MAQYYTKPHRNASCDARPLSRQQETLISTQNWEDSFATPSASFYVFPDPSGSTSPSSALSPDPPSTQVIFSPYSEMASIEGSLLPTPILLTPVRGRENVWEWPKALESTLVSPPHRPQLNRTKHWTPRIEKKPLGLGSGVFGARGSSQRTFSPAPARGRGTSSRAVNEVPNEVPVAERSPSISSHVPFLSFFTSLLSTDRMTHGMVTNMSILSLFHTTIIPPGGVDTDANLSLEAPLGKDSHGIGKFVVCMSEEGQLYLGPITSGSDIPAAFPLILNLSGVLGIVTEIGGRLLQVVFRV